MYIYVCVSIPGTERLFGAFNKYLVNKVSPKVRVLQNILGYISESRMALNTTGLIKTPLELKSRVATWETDSFKVCRA